jgi:hypothetical protein
VAERSTNLENCGETEGPLGCEPVSESGPPQFALDA